MENLPKNVNAYGLGYKKSRSVYKKIKNFLNRIRGKKALIYFVEKKVPKEELAPADLIPERMGNMETDVVEIGELHLMQGLPHRQKYRPLVAGISGMWERGTAGTIGAVVFKNGAPHILTNEHIAHPYWQGAKQGDVFMQPSPYDNTIHTDVRVGIIKYPPLIKFATPENPAYNDFDAHLVPLDAGIPYEPLKQLTIGDYNPEPKEHFAGMEVQRDGRTNGYKKGRVLATNVVAQVWMDKQKGLLANFKNQVFYENKDFVFVNGGDSGTLVIDTQKNPVGLIFAASNTVAIGTPIKNIMSGLQFTFSPPINEGYIALCENALVSFPKGEYITRVMLNLRSQPNLKGKVLTTLPAGTKVEAVEFLQEADGWFWAKVKV